MLTGEHGKRAVAERGNGERLFHRDVPATTEGTGRAGYRYCPEQHPAHHLGDWASQFQE